jgi:predicted nucleotidyltransferase
LRHPVVVTQLPARVRAVLVAADSLRASVPGIVAIALVGSWARNAGRPDSDVDLVVLTIKPELLLESNSWFAIFEAGAQLVRSEDFGLIQERRLRLADGLEVEVGIGAPEWAGTEPPDAGSARVVRDGMRILYDPEQLLAVFAAVVETPGE